MVMVQDSVFVLHHLAVQFIDQVIDGRIEVLVRTFCKQIIAFDMNIALCSLTFIFRFLGRCRTLEPTKLVVVALNRCGCLESAEAVT